jgi:hypothetical protein
MYKPSDFKTLTKEHIRAILEANKMEGRLEHGEFRFWLCEFISLPYGSKLDKPFLCSYLREMTWNMTISCYPIEPTMAKLNARLDIVAAAMFEKHQQNLAAE